MANPENLRGHEFRKGQSGNPKGRPKNRVPEMIVDALKLSSRKELTAGMSIEEVQQWEQFLMVASSDDVVILPQDSGIPVYARALAKAILVDMKNGKTRTLDKLRDRTYGKVTDRVELTGRDGAPLVPARRLTQEEAGELFRKLEEEF